jgi:hypothetical protein
MVRRFEIIKTAKKSNFLRSIRSQQKLVISEIWKILEIYRLHGPQLARLFIRTAANSKFRVRLHGFFQHKRPWPNALGTFFLS